MEPSLNMLEHILEDWEQTKCQNTISMFDTFYYNIKHREQLIDRLWERIIPKSNFSFDEYDAKNDEWHHIPYSYEQFQ